MAAEEFGEGGQLIGRISGSSWPKNLPREFPVDLIYKENVLHQSEGKAIVVVVLIFSNILIICSLKRKKDEWSTGKLWYQKHYLMDDVMINEAPATCLEATKVSQLKWPWLLQNTLDILNQDPRKRNTSVFSVADKGKQGVLKSKLHKAICNYHLSRNPALEKQMGWVHKYREGTVFSCCMKDDVDCLQLIIHKYPDLWQEKDIFGFTPIDLIIHYASCDCFEYLISSGDLNAAHIDEKGMSLLHRASMSGASDICEILLNNGAEVDALTNSGLAALHLAIQENHEMTVKVLLQSGANPNLRTQTKDRQPPVNLAVSEMILGWLVAYGGRVCRQTTATKRWPDADLESKECLYFEQINENNARISEDMVSKGDTQWVDDKTSPTCMLCETKWSMTNRRHHCRSCGHLVCGKCARKKLRFREQGIVKTLRACDVCVNVAHANSTDIIKFPSNGQLLRLNPKEVIEYKIHGSIEDGLGDTNVSGGAYQNETSQGKGLEYKEEMNSSDFEDNAKRTPEASQQLSGPSAHPEMDQMNQQLRLNMEKTKQIEDASSRVGNRAAELEAKVQKLLAKKNKKN